MCSLWMVVTLKKVVVGRLGVEEVEGVELNFLRKVEETKDLKRSWSCVL